jgi:hypothetical protein
VSMTFTTTNRVATATSLIVLRNIKAFLRNVAWISCETGAWELAVESKKPNNREVTEYFRQLLHAKALMRNKNQRPIRKGTHRMDASPRFQSYLEEARRRTTTAIAGAMTRKVRLLQLM